MDSLLPFLNTTILGISTILFFSYYLLRRSRFKTSENQSLPEAPGKWPVIGHLPLLSGSQLPHVTLGTIADKLGPIFTIRIGVHTALVVSCWEVAKELFTKYDVAISSRPKSMAGKILGYNYAGFGASPYGPYWRELRKITARDLLSSRRLNSLKHVRDTEVATGLKEIYKLWTSKRNGSSHVLFNMEEWISDLNLNVILRMIAGKRYFGASVGADGDERLEVIRYKNAMKEFFYLFGFFMLGDAVPLLGWLDFGRYERAMKKTAKELDNLVGEWLVEHRSRKRQQSGDDQAAASVGNDDQDFMDMLISVFDGTDNINNDSGYDVDTVIKSTCLAIVTGATDTTAVNIAWVISLLLNHRETLKKVQEELDSVVGKERVMVSESDISKLVYLQAVIKETLRLYPTGPLSGMREFSQDCNVAGYHITKGTRLLLNLWKMQMDPRVWTDPVEFKPERFLTTHKDVDVKGQNFEFLPFGGGRRNCPGLPFAMLMSHVAVANFLHAFDVSTPLHAPVDMTGRDGLIMHRATPLEVLVEPRLPLNLYE